MRYSRFLFLSTIPVFAFLMATTAVPADVPFTQALGLLKPQEPWKIGAVNSSSAPYCAMVDKFEKGVVLAFSRDTAGHMAIAVDFNGDYFKPDTTYEVAMHPDDASARKFSGRAGNDRSVVIQMSQDDRLYNMLDDASSLDVALPSVAATLALHNFAHSYAALADCAAALQPVGPKTAAVPVPVVEKTALPLADISAVKERARNEEALDTAQIKLSSLESRLAQAEREKQELVASLDTQSRQTSFLREALGAKEPEQAAATHEKQELTASLDAQTRQTKLLQETLSAKEQELTALKTVSAEDKRTLVLTQDELKTLKPEQAAAAHEKQELTASLDAQTRQTKLLQETLSAKDQELAALKTVSAEDKRTLVLTQDELKTLKPEQAAAAHEKQELTASLDAQTRQTKLLQETLSAKEQELTVAKNFSADDKKRLVIVQDELKSLKPAYASVVTEMQGHLKDKEAQYDSLRKQFETQMRPDNSALVAELGSRKEEVAKMKKQLAEAEVQGEVASENAAKATADLEKSRQQLAELKKTLTAEQEQLAQLQGHRKLAAASDKKKSPAAADKIPESHKEAAVVVLTPPAGVKDAHSGAGKPAAAPAGAEASFLMEEKILSENEAPPPADLKNALLRKESVPVDKVSEHAEAFLSKIAETGSRAEPPVISGTRKEPIELKFNIPPSGETVSSGAVEPFATIVIE